MKVSRQLSTKCLRPISGALLSVPAGPILPNNGKLTPLPKHIRKIAFLSNLSARMCAFLTNTSPKTSFNPSNPSTGKRAFLTSADLALTFLILLAVAIPTFNYSLYAQTLSSYEANTAQKLSVLLQESMFAYFYSAAVQNNSQISIEPLSQGNFAKAGRLSQDFQPSAQYTEERGANLSLHSLSYHASSPPPILQKNQICIKRKMLDSTNRPISFWACGY